MKSTTTSAAAVDDLSMRVAVNEHAARSCHLELGNIRPTKDEDVEQVVVDVAKKAGVAMIKEDIAEARRLRAGPEKIPNILVEFSSKKKRNELLSNRKSLMVPVIQERIYINESLCPTFKNLLRLTKEKCQGYRFVWYKNFKIFVKKSEGGRVVAISNLDDLNNLKVINNDGDIAVDTSNLDDVNDDLKVQS